MDQVVENVGKHINAEDNEPPHKLGNNKSQIGVSKKEREAFKKKQHQEKGHYPIEIKKDDEIDEYVAPNSKEEYNKDTQSVEEGDQLHQEINLEQQPQIGPCYIVIILKRFNKLLASMDCILEVEKNLEKQMIVSTYHIIGLGIELFAYYSHMLEF